MKRAFYYGLISSVAAGIIFVVFRLTLQVLTPPEVLADFVARVVPLNWFLLGVSTLGSWAKVLLVIGLALIFIAVGGLVGMLFHFLINKWEWSRRLGKGWASLLWGVIMWLLAMVVILPISGKGFFGFQVQPFPVTILLVWLLASLVFSFAFAGLSLRPEAVPEEPGETGVSRRSFLKSIAYIGAGLVVAGGISAALWKIITSTRQSMFGKGKMPSEVTSNEDFYAVSKNFGDPEVDAKSWKLQITGLVDREVTINYQQLLALPAVTEYLTLECIGNEIGGDQIGNALWKGIRLRDLLSSVTIKDSVRKLALYATDDYSDSITLSKAMEDGTILAYEMNGVPLPAKHGFPARLLVPGIYGMKNVKWLTKIELVDYDFVGFWEGAGWSNEAVIKTMSRIDVPGDVGQFKPNEPLMLGGIAFSGDRGVSRVEVSVDNGETWQPAELAPALSQYTWVLWIYNWTPPENGNYTVRVRATDGQGNVQTGDRTEALPDGATGYDSTYIVVVPNPSTTP